MQAKYLRALLLDSVDTNTHVNFRNNAIQKPAKKSRMLRNENLFRKYTRTVTSSLKIFEVSALPSPDSKPRCQIEFRLKTRKQRPKTLNIQPHPSKDEFLVP